MNNISVMYFSIFLVFFTFNPGFAVRIQMKTLEVKGWVMRSANITCSCENVGQQVSEIASLQLLGPDDVVIANLHHNSTVSVAEDLYLSKVEVHGRLSTDILKTYLTVILHNMVSAQSGQYKCKLYFFDHSHFMTEDITGNFLDAGKQDVNQLVMFLMSRMSNLEEENEKLGQENKARSVALEEMIKNQSDVINEKVSGVKARVGDLETFTTNQSVILADLHDKDTALSAFSAGYNGNDRFKDGDVMIFRQVLVNIGNDYNNANGQYTAPRDGLYVFHLTIGTWWNQSILEVDIIANGNLVARIHARDKTFYDQSSGSALVQLEKGHVVKTVVYDITNGYDRAWGFPYSMFTGYLFKPL